MTDTLKEKVGNYDVDLSPALLENGNLDANKSSEIYRQLGMRICAEQDAPSRELKQEYFNFLCNISSLKGSQIAQYLKLDRGQISQWRRSDKEIAKPSWGLIRVFFLDLLSNNYQVTNPVFTIGMTSYEGVRGSSYERFLKIMKDSGWTSKDETNSIKALRSHLKGRYITIPDDIEPPIKQSKG